MQVHFNTLHHKIHNILLNHWLYFVGRCPCTDQDYKSFYTRFTCTWFTNQALVIQCKDVSQRTASYQVNRLDHRFVTGIGYRLSLLHTTFVLSWLRTTREKATKHVYNTKIHEMRCMCRGFLCSFVLLQETNFSCFGFFIVLQ